MRARWIGAVALLAGCGNVVFIDPDATLKDELIVTDADRLRVDGDPRSYFHVVIGTRQGLDLFQLAASGPEGTIALPLADAHQQPCGTDETCFSFTLGPGVPDDLQDVALDAPTLGHRSSRRLRVRTLGAYQLDGAARSRNEQILMTVVDPIRTFFRGADEQIQLFPRELEAVVRPGACGEPIDVFDPGWTTVTTLPFTLTATFSEGLDPSACIALRPAEPAGGGATASRTIPARAVVTTFTHTYAAPTELSPLVYMPIYNLELPSSERCSEAQMLIASALREAAAQIAADEAEGTDTLELDPINLANKDGIPCRQLDDPRIDDDVVGGRIEAQIRERFGDRRVRVVFVYVTNLQIPMPMNLEVDLQNLREYFRTRGSIRDFMMAVAPEQAIRQLNTDDMLPWVATEEPSFRDSILAILAGLWPFKSAIHSPATIVPLVGEAEAGRYRYYRICTATPPVTALGAPVEGTTVLAPPPEGPAYRVDLPEQILERAPLYVAPSVQVQWEACEALCDREAPDGNPGVPWLMDFGC